MASEAKKRNTPKTLKAAGRFLVIIILIGIITGCILACVLTVFVLNTLKNEEPIDLDTVDLNYTTIIYAQDPSTGEEVEVQRVQNIENRIWVDYEQMPPHLLQALIAIEDKRFPTHIGVDFRRTIMSTINMVIPIYEGTPGGSTITQQLIKNITKDDSPDIPRKIREIFRAINLERHYSKEQILEAYLNVVQFGAGRNGIEAAANLYFGKSTQELTLAESAAIVGITQNPSKFNPFRFPENNRDRQLVVLNAMLDQEKITQELYDEAVAEELKWQEEEYTQSREMIQNWFVDALYEEIISDLVSRKGYTRTGAEDALLSGGFRIYSTMDVAMQEYLNKAYIDMENTFPPVYNETYPESAMIIIDHSNGQVKGMMGSNRPKEGARLFNRATSALRHPGSTIKPISIYSLALEQNLINYSMLYEDSPILLRPNDPTSIYPKNFYNTYLQNITIHEAIMRSTNTIPVKLCQTLTPRASFNFLRDKLGFVNLVEKDVRNGRTFSDIDLSPMALGSMTDGVTVLEMAGGFQMIGNGGVYTKPHTYTKVLDYEGNVILENNYVPNRVISQDTAVILNQLLQQVTVGPLGTGRAAAMGNIPVAGKTGTSNDDENQWFIGVTPYYVGAVWLGYDDPETIRYPSYPPPRIWKNIMQPLHSGLPAKEFPTSTSVVSYAYCKESGLKATDRCTETATGYYKVSQPLPDCELHDREEEMEDDNGFDWWNGGWSWGSDRSDSQDSDDE